MANLQSVFLSDYPRSIIGYNLLLTQLRWRDAGLDYGLQVYSPFGDVGNRFVTINDKASSYDIVIQYPKDDTNILEEALRKSNVIDWKKDNIQLTFAVSNVVKCVQTVTEEKDIEVKLTPEDLNPMYTFVMEKDNPVFKDISLPRGFTFDLLSAEHVDLIDSTWPYRYSTSLHHFQLLVYSKSGYGLFNDGEIISWIFITECGNLRHLYTLPKYRKKGYAELVVKLISNVILKYKGDVFAFCKSV